MPILTPSPDPLVAIMTELPDDINVLLRERQYQVLMQYFSLHFDTRQLILHAVEKSTIRAFHFDKHYKTYKPISIFRTWARDYLKENKELLKTSDNFSAIHTEAAASLNDYWLEIDESNIEPYQKYKLIDLLFKFIPRWKELDEIRKYWFFQNVNVPLDSYSLKLLKKYSAYELNIPDNASMNFVTGDAHYYLLQNAIKEISTNNPPIVFDLLAWNSFHSEEEFQLQKHNKKPKQTATNSGLASVGHDE